MNETHTLFVVATPIGNMGDVTLRAIETLKSVSIIICEDTRVTGNLLSKLEIAGKKLIALNEFNEEQIVYQVLKELETENTALVSDAGTPLISDPGYRLVSEARKKDIKVVTIPGASSVIAALSASGLPTDKFVFLGFLPKTQGKTDRLLKEYASLDSKPTIIFFESPHRLLKTLENLQVLFGDIQITIARELTKIHEEIITDTATSLLDKYKNGVKGEIVILFSLK